MITHLIKFKKMVDLPMKMLAPLSTEPPFTKQYGVLHRLNWSWKGHVSYVKRPMHSDSWHVQGISWDFLLLNETLQWRHNGRDGVSNHQSHDCLLSRLFKRRSKKTSKLCVTGLCVGNSPVTGAFPAQKASSAENVSIWWRLHDSDCFLWNPDL